MTTTIHERAVLHAANIVNSDRVSASLSWALVRQSFRSPAPTILLLHL
jgi:hypothetical protein